MGVVGTAVLVAGIIAIPYPGPGWLILFAGLAILGTEFQWAQQVLHWTRARYDSWTAWLRRPLPSALRRTGTMLRSVPPDWASVAAFAEAVAGLPWVLRERRVVPAAVERGLPLLEEPQRQSPARRYVG